MLYVSQDVDVREELIVSQGEKLVKEEPSLVYVSIAPRGSSTRLMCFVGPKAREAGVAADALVRELAKAVGGSGNLRSGRLTKRLNYLKDVAPGICKERDAKP